METFVFLDYFNLLFAIYSLLDEADSSRLMRQNSRSRVKVETYKRVPMRAFPLRFGSWSEVVYAQKDEWKTRRKHGNVTIFV